MREDRRGPLMTFEREGRFRRAARLILRFLRYFCTCTPPVVADITLIAFDPLLFWGQCTWPGAEWGALPDFPHGSCPVLSASVPCGPASCAPGALRHASIARGALDPGAGPGRILTVGLEEAERERGNVKAAYLSGFVVQHDFAVG